MSQLENGVVSSVPTDYERESDSIHDGIVIPLVSVIILTCNNKQYVVQCLNSLSEVDYKNLEIIVVDNASSDGTSSLLSQKFPYVKVVRSNRNIGYAGGNNLGIRNAKGTYLILLNDDTLVDTHFITRLVEAMEAEPRAALGSPKIYMMRGKTIQYAGGFIDRIGYPIMRGLGEEDNGQYDRLEEIEWASGACMIIRRNYLEEIGSLDDSYYIYYEDTDLSFRAREGGYKVIYIPMAIIRHHGSVTTRRHRLFQIFSVRNRYRFLLRHFGRAHIARGIAWDFFHTAPRKAPYLFVALLWSYPSLLAAMLNIPRKKIHSVYSILSTGCVRYILYYWRVGIKTFLTALIGKKRIYRLLDYNMRLNLIFYPFFVVRVLNNVVQTKIGSNIILQPIDNLFLNEEINFSQVYDHFYEIGKDDTIIDVGAHVGTFTLRAARKAINGLVLAIEPHSFNYWLLTNNVKVNKLDNVQTLRLALWSSNGTMKLYLAASGSHSLKPYLKDTGKYLEVQTRTLDSIVKKFGIKRVNFIKIDVEGAELEVLRGAEEILKRNNLFLSIAAYHTPTEVQEISQYLRKNGFRVFVYELNQHYIYIYGFKAEGNLQIKGNWKKR